MSDIKRKLATVQTIANIEAIEGADRIRKITFNKVGWQCVTNQQLIIGDRVIYFEVDSVLPAETPYKDAEGKPIFAFMEPYRYRVKVIRLRGIYSQGLTMPLSDFPGLVEGDVEDGFDVTDALGVVKYEIPEFSSTASDAKGSFPGFAEKSDEERAENIPNLEKILAEHEWDITVKMDGTSALYYFREGEFGVCSRNIELKETEGNAHWKCAKLYGIQERLKAYNRNIGLQGEVCGPGISGNRIGLTSPRLFLYTIQDLDNNTRLTRKEMEELIAYPLFDGPGLKLELVPEVKNFVKPKNLADLLALSDGTFLITDKLREGIVLRAKDDPRISFKIINPKYKVKHDC